MGVYYSQPNQDEEMGEAFCKQLAEVVQSPALILMEDCNFPDIIRKYNTAQRKQAKTFLKDMEENFLTQLVCEPTRGGTLVVLLFTNRRTGGRCGGQELSQAE